MLADGTLGLLVPIGDDEALAAAIATTLDHPPDAERLIKSTDRFSIKASIDAYSSLIDDLRQRCAA